MTKFLPSSGEEPKKTKHSATDRDKCYEMETRYGWKLWKIDEHPNAPIMKADCIFLGEAEFPKHWTEENDDE